jgi:hypothetical protein
VATERNPVDASTLRIAEKFFGYATYTIAAYVGACMLYMSPDRFGSANWGTAFRLFPGGSITWGIIYLLVGIIGLLSVRGNEATRRIDLVCCSVLGFWAFLNGSYFWVSFFINDNGGPTGPPLLWLFASVFAARGILNLKQISPRESTG